MSAVATLVVGVVLAVVALATLAVTGRRWRIAAARPVVLALSIYAGAALGLDAVTALLVAVQDGVGALTRASTTFGEELGEAMAALFVLVTLRWQLPPGSVRPDAPDDRPGRPGQDLQVEEQRPVLHVVDVDPH